MKRSLASMLAGGILVAGLATAIAPAANANPARYGEARCYNSNEPTSGSVGPGTVKHQISPGMGYYERSFQNGNVSRIIWYQTLEQYATWATISGTYHTTSWACRDKGLFAN